MPWETREMTVWEKAVWLTFNHWEGKIGEDIHTVKTAFAGLIDLIEGWPVSSEDSYLKKAIKDMALKSCMAAQMAVVKFITWKD